jgi:hypothetical protein
MDDIGLVDMGLADRRHDEEVDCRIATVKSRESETATGWFGAMNDRFGPTSGRPAASTSRLAEKQHRGTRSDTGDAGGARDPPSERGQLFQKNKQRQQRDPKHVHHSAHKQ